MGAASSARNNRERQMDWAPAHPRPPIRGRTQRISGPVSLPGSSKLEAQPATEQPSPETEDA